MAKSNEEITNALIVIKEVCSNNLATTKSCHTCPFELDGECGICDSTSPNIWKVVEPTNFKALR